MFARKTYTPTRNRQSKDGKIDVSREELEDFRRQFGRHLTLRDLLNYDKTQTLPAAPKSEDDQRARGTQEANIRPNGGAGRGASSGPAADAQYKAPLSADTGPAGPRRDKAAEAKGAETLERMKSRAERGMTTRSNEEMRDEAKGRTLAALGAAATLAGGPLARMAGKAAQAASAGRAAAQAASRVEPRLGRPVTTKLDDAAAAFSRPQARQASKDTGYTREAMPATTAPKPTAAPKPREEILKRQAAMREGRNSQEDYVRDVMERGAEMGMKRGGMAKAYAKGGSVKGSGCEQRGLRKCKVY